MLNESHSRNNNSKSGIRFDQPVGYEFASNILVADLAIRSTAYKPPTPPKEEQGIKSRRRVTFNLDDIQIKTIPAYESSIIEEDVFVIHEEEPQEVYREEPLISQEPPLSQPTTSYNSTAERISKKESYDALLKRKQFRRDQQQPTIKPGYWYPLASTRHQTRQSLPTIRSLEMTEKLINESIQREIALNPNLHYTPPSPSPSPSRSDTMNHLIEDSEEEEEQERDIPTTNTTMISSEHAEEESTTTTVLLPPPNRIEEEQDNFTKSVYHELSRKSQQVLFPFEHNLIPITTNIISPPPSPPPIEHDSDIWIDHPFLLLQGSNTTNSSNSSKKGIFFVKILNTESLDFPMNNDENTIAYSSIGYKDITSKSNKQILSHSMQINHEMKIEHVDPNEQITIKIHVMNKKYSTHHWLHRIINNNHDLERYIKEKDGSICQTIFSPILNEESMDKTATLMLVNHWYKPTQHHWKKNILKEKAVGKLQIHYLYITTDSNQQGPNTMEEAIEALNAKRFHQTQWQSGYLSQLGGNTNCLKERYFTLTGGELIAYQKQEEKPLYKISLQRVKKLVCDHIVIAEAKSDTTTCSVLLDQLDSVIESIQEVNTPENTLENGFQLIFDNGEHIQFMCDTIEDRSKWISLLKVMICKLPKLPQWVTL